LDRKPSVRSASSFLNSTAPLSRQACAAASKCNRARLPALLRLPLLLRLGALLFGLLRRPRPLLRPLLLRLLRPLLLRLLRLSLLLRLLLSLLSRTKPGCCITVSQGEAGMKKL
jgi:hypothetical protein